MAQSECGGWQIKRNIAVSRLASAQRWAGYLVDQGKRHLIVPRIKGKVIGVSRSINYAPVEAQRAALEAWKRDVGCGAMRKTQKATKRRAYRLWEGIGRLAK